MSNPVFSASEISARIRQEVGAEKPAAVCFDFFDTLVGRSVLPEDTKKIASNRLVDQLNCGLTGAELYRIRSKIENRLCLSNQGSGHDAEFNLTELAREIHARLIRFDP